MSSHESLTAASVAPDCFTRCGAPQQATAASAPPTAQQTSSPSPQCCPYCLSCGPQQHQLFEVWPTSSMPGCSISATHCAPSSPSWFSNSHSLRTLTVCWDPCAQAASMRRSWSISCMRSRRRDTCTDGDTQHMSGHLKQELISCMPRLMNTLRQVPELCLADMLWSAHRTSCCKIEHYNLVRQTWQSCWATLCSAPGLAARQAAIGPAQEVTWQRQAPHNHVEDVQMSTASRQHVFITHLDWLCGRLLHTSPRWQHIKRLDSPLLLTLLSRGPVQYSHQKVSTEGLAPCRANLQGSPSSMTQCLAPVRRVHNCKHCCIHTATHYLHNRGLKEVLQSHARPQA